MKKIIPNTITLLNLLSGCLAITCAMDPLQTVGLLPAYKVSFCFIMLAAAADFFDGLCARLLNSYSDLGKQLDSLSDLVSFGVAPAMLMYSLLTHAGAPFWACLLVLLQPLCGALRLARFNIDTTQSHSFRGLPIPAGALFTVGLASILAGHSGANLYALCGCMLAVSVLMIAPIRMYSFKIQGARLATLFWPATLVCAGAVCLMVWGWEGLFYTVGYYVVSSFVASLFVTGKSR